VLITGTHKAYALAKCIEEGVNHMFTVSAIQMHPKSIVVCDEDATLELRVSCPTFCGYALLPAAALAHMVTEAIAATVGTHPIARVETRFLTYQRVRFLCAGAHGQIFQVVATS
jgi:hypothetical protein